MEEKKTDRHTLVCPHVVTPRTCLCDPACPCRIVGNCLAMSGDSIPTSAPLEFQECVTAEQLWRHPAQSSGVPGHQGRLALAMALCDRLKSLQSEKLPDLEQRVRELEQRLNGLPSEATLEGRILMLEAEVRSLGEDHRYYAKLAKIHRD